MGCDDSWPTMVPSMVQQNRTADHEYDARGFLFKFPSNHKFISLSFIDIRARQTDGRTTQTITVAGPTLRRAS